MGDELPQEDTLPRSDQLNGDDLLLSGPVTVTITEVRETGDKTKKQPWALELAEYPGKPWKPCLTMRRILEAAFTRSKKAMKGQRLTLYRDPDVTYGGETKGGIRISALSKLPDLNPYPITLSQTKKTSVMLKKLDGTPPVELTPDETKYIKVVSGELANVSTMDELKGHGEMLKTKSKPVQDALRPVYKKRHAELKKG